jgi:hypothetical protein
VLRNIAGPAKHSKESVVYRANEPSPAVQAVTTALRSKLTMSPA